MDNQKNMKKFLNNLENIKNEILSERKSLLFFSLFLRNDESEKWDLVMSADWVEDGKTKEVVKLILEKFRNNNVDYEPYIENFVVFSPAENLLSHIAAAYKKGSVEKTAEGNDLLKLFSDYAIEAKVIHADFSSFEIKKIPSTRNVRKVEASAVF